MCYCELNSNIIIFCKYAPSIMPQASFLACILYARRGLVTVYFLIIIREGQVIFPTRFKYQLDLADMQLYILLKSTSYSLQLQLVTQPSSYLASYIVPPELPPSKYSYIYISFKLLSHSFHYGYSQLVTQLQLARQLASKLAIAILLYEGSTFEERPKKLQLQISSFSPRNPSVIN